MFSTPNTFKSLTIAASLAFSLGKIKCLKPSSRALIAIGKSSFNRL